MPAVYTRTGDKGDTGLFGGSRVAKQGLRVEAYGSVDEANAELGRAKATLPPGEWRIRVHGIQQRLFVLAAELASDERGAQILADRVDDEDVTALEHLIDDCLAITGPQTEFVVPGRDERSGCFHVARTVVRRAERRVLTLSEVEPVRSEVIRYLNRLSDAVYALSRLAETWRDEELVQTVRAAVEKALSGRTEKTCQFDLAAAKAMAERAEARATEVGLDISFAAVDAGGNLILFHRMPDALLASIQVAVDKAWTAAAMRVPTDGLAQVATVEGGFPGLATTNSGRVVLFGGGVPIFAGGKLVGAIGVSGGTSEQDVDIARSATQGWSTNQTGVDS